MWYEERFQKDKKTSNPKFMSCCSEGRIKLPLLPPTPQELDYLLSFESGKKCVNFRKEIRTYNSIFTFTSLECRVDSKINCAKGPYIYRVGGQNYHTIDSLLLEIGKKPQFAQLYIYDTENETNNRIEAMRRQFGVDGLDLQITQDLSTMLEEHNVLKCTKSLEKNNATLSEDIATLQCKKYRAYAMQLTNDQIEAHTLFEIEAIILKMGKSLKYIDEMPLPNNELLRAFRNILVNEELDYCTLDLKVAHDIFLLHTGIFPETVGDPIESVIEMIYHYLLENCNSPSYITERAILTPENDMVQELNTFIIDMLPGEGKTYLNSDTVCKGSVQTNDEIPLYPIEFLNSLQFNGIQNHEIHLKVGAPVILLHNINQTEGLFNGTRLIVTLLGTWSVRVIVFG
ncbi:DNA helicase PIF1, ATP-dependent, partial [Cynara cardunculus var. scolymus]